MIRGPQGPVRGGARGRGREAGHLMVGLVSMLAILLIFSARGGQEWADRIRRENEAEMIFRAQEISRAIFKFQNANGRLPTELKELMDAGPDGQYFLRRMYEDPLMPDGKWGVLFAGPDGQVVDPNGPRTSYGEELGGVSSAPTRTVGGLDSGGPGRGPQETGGLPVVGVKSLCPEQPFRVYRGLSDYSQWLFTIYDLQNMQAPGGGGGPNAGQRPGARRGNPGGGGRPNRNPGGGLGGGN